MEKLALLASPVEMQPRESNMSYKEMQSPVISEAQAHETEAVSAPAEATIVDSAGASVTPPRVL